MASRYEIELLATGIGGMKPVQAKGSCIADSMEEAMAHLDDTLGKYIDHVKEHEVTYFKLEVRKSPVRSVPRKRRD